jgi:hypothetical protein
MCRFKMLNVIQIILKKTPKGKSFTKVFSNSGERPAFMMERIQEQPGA